MRIDLVREMIPSINAIALKYFRVDTLQSENKLNQGFDPVTAADREIEQHIRSQIVKNFPDDAILGEEFDQVAGGSGYQWIIDPIDGTRAFIIGAPSFTSLIALKNGNTLESGLILQPFTGETFEAHNGQCIWQRGEARQALKTSQITEISQAKLASTFPEIGTPQERAQFETLSAQAQLTRYGLDAYAYALLAMGQIDLVVEAGLKPYDYSAPQAVIEAAGGVFTNWEGKTPQGKSPKDESTILAAANPELHAKALEILNS